MQYKVSVGSSYTVTADAEDCVVTDAAGRVVATVKPGKQYTFTASTTTVELSDASAALTANFNSAPAAGSAGGVSEENLVELGVLTAGEVPTEKASSPVCVPSGNALIRAKGFRWGGQVQQPPAGCNGVAIVVGADVEDDFLLGCQMQLKCTSRSTVTLISEPLVSVQEVAAGRRCLFYFTEPISSTEQYTIRILKNGVNELVPFSCSTSQAMYGYFSWLDAVDTGSGFYPALAWEVLETETVYGPAVDKVPTEGSARPVSSGGVYNALEQISGEQVSSIYVLEILGMMYLGEAWWEQKMTMEDGLVVYMQRLPEAGGESDFRGLLTLSEPRTASQLLAALTTRTGAASGEFLVYPVSLN